MLRPEQKLFQEMVNSAITYCASAKKRNSSSKEYKENKEFLKYVDESFLIAAGFTWPIKIQKGIERLIA